MKKVAVLVDKGGTGPESLIHLIKSLREHLTIHQIRRLHREELIAGKWLDVDLLIVPGGRDFLYHQSLKGAGVQIVSQYVRDGGRYMGICAGGYFASHQVHFGIGYNNAVWGRRELGFFEGVAEGPVLGNVPYDFSSRASCDFIKLRTVFNEQSDEAWAYYNSGARFLHSEHQSTHPWRALAYYDDPRANPNDIAIVEAWPGKGYCLLCGIHPEIRSSEFKVANSIDQALLQKLIIHQSSMQLLFKQLLERALEPPAVP